MDGFIIVLVLLVFVAFAVATTAFHFSRATSILDQWAAENGYEILSRERRWMRFGPFWWRKSKGQEVYYVMIRTRDGETRRGWVRCGGWFMGILSNQADVEWRLKRRTKR